MTVPAIAPFALNGGTAPVILVPVTNTGSVPYFFNSFEIPGPDGSNGYFAVDYSVANACMTAKILAPGASCTIAMSLASYVSVGTVTGHLVVHGFAFDGTGVERAAYGLIAQTIN